MNKGYKIEDDAIVINRELTELDFFVKSFISILNKYSDYLIVSGFVSISTGRTRGTEDVDVLAPVMTRNKFKDLFDDLADNSFWCYQGDTSDETYPYIEKMESIRFARINEMFPNIEFVPADRTKKAKFYELTHPQKIRIKDFEFKIPPIEFEILYKEIILGGDKDIADARHLRVFFSEMLQDDKFKEYEPIIRGELK